MTWIDAEKEFVKDSIEWACKRMNFPKKIKKSANAYYREIKALGLTYSGFPSLGCVYLACAAHNVKVGFGELITYGYLLDPSLSTEAKERFSEKNKMTSDIVKKYLKAKNQKLGDLANSIKEVEQKYGEKETYEDLPPSMPNHYRDLDDNDFLYKSRMSIDTICHLLKLNKATEKRAKEIVTANLLWKKLANKKHLSIEFASVILAAKENKKNLNFETIKKKFYFYDLSLAKKEVKEIIPLLLTREKRLERTKKNIEKIQSKMEQETE
jgi:transcription initiation factor TFIIIB Brf1 subunit/transcription initiation factor TFIIB